MSAFELAISVVLDHEGGFADDPDDPGGATKFGISLRFYKTIKPNATIDDIRNLTIEDAIAIYKKYWWDNYQYSLIIAQSIATKVFDLAVNEGASQAHKLLQRACWSVNGYLCISSDGILGENTLAVVNESYSPALLTALRSEAAGFYRGLIASNPRNAKYKNNWLKRAYA